MGCLSSEPLEVPRCRSKHVRIKDENPFFRSARVLQDHLDLRGPGEAWRRGRGATPCSRTISTSGDTRTCGSCWPEHCSDPDPERPKWTQHSEETLGVGRADLSFDSSRPLVRPAACTGRTRRT